MILVVCPPWILIETDPFTSLDQSLTVQYTLDCNGVGPLGPCVGVEYILNTLGLLIQILIYV